MRNIAKLSVLGLALVTASAFADTKIGVVNYMKVFQQAPQGSAALDALKTNLEPQVDKLKAEQKSLTDAASKLERDQPTMSKADLKKAQDAQITKQKDFQDAVVKLRHDEMKQEQAAAKKFEDDLQSSIKAVAKAGDYDLVMSKQAAPYAASDLNLTDKVVAEMKKAN